MALGQASVSLPVRLSIENLQSIMNELQNKLGNLKVGSKGFKEVQSIMSAIGREMDRLQVQTSKPFINQNQFNQTERTIGKIEDDLERVQITMGRINFGDLKLSPDQANQMKEFEAQLQSIKASIKSVKDTAKQEFLAGTSGKAWLGIDPTAINQSLTQITTAINREVRDQKKALEEAEAKAKEYQDTLAQKTKLENFATGISKASDVKSASAAFGDMYSKIFASNGAFKNTGRKAMEEWLVNELDIDPDKVREIVSKKASDAIKSLQTTEFSSLIQGKIDSLSKKATSMAKDGDPVSKASDLKAGYEALKPVLADITTANEGVSTSEEGLKQKLRDLTTVVDEYKEKITAAARGNKEIGNSCNSANAQLANFRTQLTNANVQFLQLERTQRNFNSIKMMITNFMGFTQVLNLTKRAIRNALNHIKELDSVMNKISIVTNMTTADLWKQVDAYSEMASKYGVSIKGAYEVSQIYYQQGLQTKDVLTLTNETLKLAKISGLDYAQTTDYMTTALRGFKMEMSEASTVVDVYSNLAAHTAVTQEELAVAMSKTASSMESVGSSFEESSAMIATMVTVTRESATNIGSALKSIAARYGEMKKDPSALIDSEGQAMAFNKVDAALQSVGISMKTTDGQFRNFTDVIIELSEKWNTLESTQQRYIATQFAGNRQQSRFLALVSNADLLKSNLEYAENSKDVGTLQALKALDQIEGKTEQVRVAYQQLYTTIGAENIWKGFLDGAKNVMETMNSLPKLFGKIPIGAAAMVVDFVNVIKTVGFNLLGGISKIWNQILPTEMPDKMKTIAEQMAEVFSKTLKDKIASEDIGGQMTNQVARQAAAAGQDQNQDAGKKQTVEKAAEPAKVNTEKAVQDAEATREVAAATAQLKRDGADAGKEAAAAAEDEAESTQRIAAMRAEAAQNLTNALADTNITENIQTQIQTELSTFTIDTNTPVQQVQEMFIKILQNVEDSGGELRKAFSEASDDAILGYITGLLEKSGQVGDAGAIVGKLSVEALRNAIGAHSPAVETMITGNDYMDGLNEGISQRLNDAIAKGYEAGKSAVEGLERGLQLNANSFEKLKEGLLKEFDSLSDEAFASLEERAATRAKLAGTTFESFQNGQANAAFYKVARMRQERMEQWTDFGYSKNEALREYAKSPKSVAYINGMMSPEDLAAQKARSFDMSNGEFRILESMRLRGAHALSKDSFITDYNIDKIPFPLDSDKPKTAAGARRGYLYNGLSEQYYASRDREIAEESRRQAEEAARIKAERERSGEAFRASIADQPISQQIRLLESERAKEMDSMNRTGIGYDWTKLNNQLSSWSFDISGPKAFIDSLQRKINEEFDARQKELDSTLRGGKLRKASEELATERTNALEAARRQGIRNYEEHAALKKQYESESRRIGDKYDPYIKQLKEQKKIEEETERSYSQGESLQAKEEKARVDAQNNPLWDKDQAEQQAKQAEAQAAEAAKMQKELAQMYAADEAKAQNSVVPMRLAVQEGAEATITNGVLEVKDKVQQQMDTTPIQVPVESKTDALTDEQIAKMGALEKVKQEREAYLTNSSDGPTNYYNAIEAAKNLGFTDKQLHPKFIDETISKVKSGEEIEAETAAIEKQTEAVEANNNAKQNAEGQRESIDKETVAIEKEGSSVEAQIAKWERLKEIQAEIKAGTGDAITLKAERKGLVSELGTSYNVGDKTIDARIAELKGTTSNIEQPGTEAIEKASEEILKHTQAIEADTAAQQAAQNVAQGSETKTEAIQQETSAIEENTEAKEANKAVEAKSTSSIDFSQYKTVQPEVRDREAFVGTVATGEGVTPTKMASWAELAAAASTPVKAPDIVETEEKGAKAGSEMGDAQNAAFSSKPAQEPEVQGVPEAGAQAGEKLSESAQSAFKPPELSNTAFNVFDQNNIQQTVESITDILEKIGTVSEEQKAKLLELFNTEGKLGDFVTEYNKVIGTNQQGQQSTFVAPTDPVAAMAYNNPMTNPMTSTSTFAADGLDASASIAQMQALIDKMVEAKMISEETGAALKATLEGDGESAAIITALSALIDKLVQVGALSEEAGAKYKAALSSATPEQLTATMEGLTTAIQTTGNAAETAGSKLKNMNFSSLGSAIRMLASISGLSKQAKGWITILGGAFTALGVIIKMVDKTSKTAAASNPWMGIAMAVMALVNGISLLWETDEEKLESLSKKAEELSNNSKKLTAEARELKNSKKTLDELEKTRYDSAEAAEKYQEKVDSLADSFPGLIEGFDEAGNVILNTARLEDELTAAREKAAQAAYDAAQAERKKYEEEAKQAQTKISNKSNWEGPTKGAAVESNLRNDFKAPKWLTDAYEVSHNYQSWGIDLNNTLGEYYKPEDYLSVVKAQTKSALSSDVAYEYSYATKHENDNSGAMLKSLQKLQLAGQGDAKLEEIYQLMSLVREKGGIANLLLEDIPEPLRDLIGIGDFDVGTTFKDWANFKEFDVSWLEDTSEVGTELFNTLELLHEGTMALKPLSEGGGTSSVLQSELKDRKLNNQALLKITDDVELVAAAVDAYQTAVDEGDWEAAEAAYQDLRVIQTAVNGSTDKNLDYLKTYFGEIDETLGTIGPLISQANTSLKSAGASSKKQISNRLSQIYSGYKKFYDDESGLTDIITQNMYAEYEAQKDTEGGEKDFDKWLTSSGEQLASSYGQYMEGFWTKLSSSQSDQLKQMLASPDKYSAGDIIEAFEIDTDDPVADALINAYKGRAEAIQNRLKEKFKKSEWVNEENLNDAQLQKFKAFKADMDVSSWDADTVQEEKYLNSVYDQFKTLYDSGYTNKALDYGEKAMALYTSIEKLPPLVRSTVFDYVSTNGLNTVEGINKTIEQIKADDNLDDAQKSALIDQLEDAKSQIVTNFGLELQAAVDSYLESWKDNSKTFSKLTSGLDISDVSSIIESDVGKDMGLSVKDFITDGNKLVLSAEKAQEYVDNYFIDQRNKLLEYQDNLDNSLGNWAIKDSEGKFTGETTLHDKTIVNEYGQAQIEGLIGVGNLKKYAHQRKDGKWVIDNAAELNEAIKQGYEQSSEYIQKYGEYLDWSEEQITKANEWKVGDYSSLKKIFNIEDSADTDADLEKKLKEITVRGADLSDYVDTPDVKNAVNKMQGATSKLLADIISKGVNNIDFSTFDFSDYEGLPEWIVEEIKNTTFSSSYDLVKKYAQYIGGTIQDSNELLAKALEEDQKKTTADAIKNLTFIKGNKFTATLSELKDFANRYDLDLAYLIDNGIAVYDKTIGEYVVNYTDLADKFDTSQIEGFADTVQDSIDKLFAELAKLVKNAMDGALSNVERQNLINQAKEYGVNLDKDLDFEKTNNGWQLTMEATDRFLQAMKDGDASIAEMNNLAVAQYKRRVQEYSVDDIKDLQFLDSSHFSASDNELLSLASKFNLDLYDLMAKGLIRWDTQLKEYVVDWLNIDGLADKLQDIDGFDDTVADSVKQLFSGITDLISKGLDGSLTSAEGTQLKDWAGKLGLDETQIHLTETAEGFKLATDSAESLYVAVNNVNSLAGSLVFDKLYESLVKNDDRFKSIQSTATAIKNIEGDIVEEETALAKQQEQFAHAKEEYKAARSGGRAPNIEAFKGLKGNVDMYARPSIDNGDGSYSTILGTEYTDIGLQEQEVHMLMTPIPKWAENTEDILTDEELNQYVQNLLDKNPKDVTALLKLDAEGMDINGKHYSNLLIDTKDASKVTAAAFHDEAIALHEWSDAWESARNGIEAPDNSERLEALKEELAIAQKIQAIRGTSEDDSYKFMEQKIPAGQNNPLNYMENWAKAYEAMKASTEGGKDQKGFMEYEDFYNLATEMGHLADITGNAVSIGGKVVNNSQEAADLITQAAGALKVTSDGKMKVDLSGIGVDFKAGADQMNKDVEAGINEVAQAQIDMLDSMIKLLEVIVAMEDLGDVDVNGDNVINLDEVFKVEYDENGQAKAIEGFTKEYENFRQNIIDQITEYNADGSKNQKFNKDLADAMGKVRINGQTLASLIQLDEASWKNKSVSEAKAFTQTLSALYQAAMSDNFDLDNVAESVYKVLEESGLDDLSIDIGNKTFYIKGGITSCIDWSDQDLVKSVEDAFDKFIDDNEDLFEGVTKNSSIQEKVYAMQKLLEEGKIEGEARKEIEWDMKLLTGEVKITESKSGKKTIYTGTYKGVKFTSTSKTEVENAIKKAIELEAQGLDFKATTNKDGKGIDVEAYKNINGAKIILGKNEAGEDKFYYKDTEYDTLDEAIAAAVMDGFANEELAGYQFTLPSGDVVEARYNSDLNIGYAFDIASGKYIYKGREFPTTESLFRYVKDVEPFLKKGEWDTDIDGDWELNVNSKDGVTIKRNLKTGEIIYEIDGITFKSMKAYGEYISKKKLIEAQKGKGSTITLDDTGMTATFVQGGFKVTMHTDTNGHTEYVVKMDDGGTFTAYDEAGLKAALATAASIANMTPEITDEDVKGKEDGVAFTYTNNSGLTVTAKFNGEVTPSDNSEEANKIVEASKASLQSDVENSADASSVDVPIKKVNVSAEEIDATTVGEQIVSALQTYLDEHPITPKIGTGDGGGDEGGSSSGSDGGVSVIAKIAEILNGISADNFTAIKTAVEGITADNVTAIQTAQDAIKDDKVKAIQTEQNNIKDDKVKAIQTAQNSIKTDKINAVQAKLNSLSAKVTTSISASDASAGLTVHVTKTGGTGATGNIGAFAKGNIALAGGTRTLMGELGPELVVSNGHYFLAGQNGAEFVDLEKDAIVFNHKQTERLLSQGGIGSRGVPFTNEQNAISFAKGNIGPAMESGTSEKIDDIYWTNTGKSHTKKFDKIATFKVEKTDASISAGGSGGCFVAGTKVTMADGTKKNIEDMIIGDEVIAYNDVLERFEVRKVNKTLPHYNTPRVLEITFSNGTTLGITPGHPILTTAGWKSRDIENSLYEHNTIATWLEIGDEVIGYEGNAFVTGINELNIPKNYTTYNVEVETCHTFMVDGLVVHNAKAAQAKGTGPAMASASAALAALKQLRAMWESLQKTSAQDLAGLGGSSGGGGGGGSDKQAAFIKELEKWYNWLQKIAECETKINYQETLRSKISSDNLKNGIAYYNSQKKSLEQLQKQLAYTKDLAVSQQKYFDQRREELNSQSNPFSSLYSFDEDGQLQYKSGALKKLSQMSGTDKYGAPNKTAKQQYEYIVNTLKIDKKYLMHDSSGNEIEFDKKGKPKDDAAYQAAVQAFWDKIEADKEEMQSLHDSVNEYSQNVLELQQAENELLQEMQDNQMDLENAILDAVVEGRKREIDKLSDLKNAYQDASSKMIHGLSDALNKEKDKYSKNQDDAELLQLRRRLALLQRSGGSASEIANLQKQIKDKSQNAYFEEQQRQIDALQDAADEQVERMDTQINILTETLEYQKKYGLLWNDVKDIMDKSPEAIAEYIRQNTEKYWADSPLASSENANDWLFKAEQWTSFRDDTDSILKTLANTGHEATSQDTKEFRTAMSDAYGSSWKNLSDSMKDKITEKFKEEYAKTGDFKAATDTVKNDSTVKNQMIRAGNWDSKASDYATKFGDKWTSELAAQVKETYVEKGATAAENLLAEQAIWTYKKNDKGQYVAVGATDASQQGITKAEAQKGADRTNAWDAFVKSYGSSWNMLTSDQVTKFKKAYVSAYNSAYSSGASAAAEAAEKAVKQDSDFKQFLTNKGKKEWSIYQKNANSKWTMKKVTDAKALKKGKTPKSKKTITTYAKAYDDMVANNKKFDSWQKKKKKNKNAKAPSYQVRYKYDKGGMVESTGTALLHAKESVLTSQQTSILRNDILGKQDNSLLNLLLDFRKAYTNIGNTATTAEPSIIIENASVNMNVASIANDYDAKRAGEQALSEMLKIARKKGAASALRR